MDGCSENVRPVRGMAGLGPGCLEDGSDVPCHFNPPSTPSVKRDLWAPAKSAGYTVGGILGAGAFAEVRIAWKTRSKSREPEVSDVVALKRISRQHNDTNLNEYMIMKALRHPLVVGVGGMVDARDALYVELEYADGGDLFKAISPDSQGLDEVIARRYMRDVIAGLAFIHSKRIVHCDVKPENILLSGGRAKLADFGLAAHHGAQRPHPAVGTAPYMAPELVQQTATRYSVHAANDVWGFAIILYAVFFADLPWEAAMPDDPDYAKFLKQRESLNLYPFPLLSVPVRKLFQAMLSEDPSSRPTSRALVEFFSKGRAWFRNDADSDEELDVWIKQRQQPQQGESTLDMVCKILSGSPLSSLVSSARSEADPMEVEVSATPASSRRGSALDDGYTSAGDDGGWTPINYFSSALKIFR